jgi:hypothetical protein
MRLQTILTLALCATIVPIASAQRISTTVDGRTVVYPDVEPVMMNGRVMVPLRGVFEHMGAYVEWDSLSQEVKVTDEGTVVLLRIGSSTATVNGNIVPIDAPATMLRGRTMVPLRFISETFGHDVYWNAPVRTVEITTVAAENTDPPPYGMMTIARDTVIPFKLQTPLNSRTARVGDRFTATIDTAGDPNYEGLPMGTILEGHVTTVRAKTSSAPGVIGVEFDRVRLPNTNAYAIDGALIGLDEKSVINDDGTFKARNSSSNDDLKWVGYGAAAGVLVGILTDGNLVTDTVIGAALGYLFGRTQVDPSKYRDLNLTAGTRFGVRLDQDLRFRTT